MMLPHFMGRWHIAVCFDMLMFQYLMVFDTVYDDTLARHNDILTLYIMLFDIYVIHVYHDIVKKSYSLLG